MKSQYSTFTTKTDSSTASLVADSENSKPYLANQTAFLSYCSQVRVIAVNQTVKPVTGWPILTVKEWVSV